MKTDIKSCTWHTGSLASKASTPKQRSKNASPPLPPHKPPAAVRHSFFALSLLAAGSPEQPKLGSADSTLGVPSHPQPGREAHDISPQIQADVARSLGMRQAYTSPEASLRHGGIDRIANTDSSESFEYQQTAVRHRRAASASAADALGLQTGMSLLDTQNLDELSGTGKQPAFQRAMSMLSTMGSMGTLTCPVVPPAWDSESEDGRSAHGDADSGAESDESGAIAGPVSSLNTASRARLASDWDSAQAMSAGAALEAGRHQREATAAGAGADVRPVFMKALQILTSGRPAANSEDNDKPAESLHSLQPALAHAETPAASQSSLFGLPANVLDEAGSSRAMAKTSADIRASEVDRSVSSVAENETRKSSSGDSRASDVSASVDTIAEPAEFQPVKSSGGYRPRRLSAAAKPFVADALSSADKASAGRPLSSVPWQSTAAPWMRKAASPAGSLPKAGTASQKGTAVPAASSLPQQPVESSFKGPSRFATEVGTSHGTAASNALNSVALPGALSDAESLLEGPSRSATEVGTSHSHSGTGALTPQVLALPGALSYADDLMSHAQLAGMEAGPSHDPRQKLDFSRAPSSTVRLLMYLSTASLHPAAGFSIYMSRP